jgi:mevalonate kinase
MAWVVAIAGPRLNTRKNVMALRQRFEEAPQQIQPVFQHIGDLVEAGVSALEGGRLEELGRLMNENQIALARLGLSSEALDGLCARLWARGAWGAKLTGAGGGGAVVALHPEPDTLAEQLRTEGVEAFVAHWGRP